MDKQIVKVGAIRDIAMMLLEDIEPTYIVTHRYKWRQFWKIIYWHLFMKKKIQVFVDYAGSKYNDEIFEAVRYKAMYGRSDFIPDKPND